MSSIAAPPPGAAAAPPPSPAPAPRPEKGVRPRSARDLADRFFRGGARGAGVTVLAIMVAVGLFLSLQATDAVREAGWSFFTTEEWAPGAGGFGIAAVLFGTVMIALVAITIAVPLALGTALYISEYAPRGLKQTLVNAVDLMAAVPSVVYGLWGLFLLQPYLMVEGEQGNGIPRWLSTWFGWIPIFRVDGVNRDDPLSTASVYTSSTLIAGIVVAMMVTPIACSVMREVFDQAPIGEREGAYALGATRWGMIRAVVLPFGRGGIIGGTMLGLGRALGETIGVYMIISPIFEVQWQILENGAISISSLIALRYGDASPFGMSALMAAGMTLFLVTLVVNFTASTIVARSRSGAESEV
ncbi:phosphate ABC transporter permease subunit PstC [Allostreptomyces psammosilenae]|uniref:Phosphate transport system permease protein n=1 Tax=Allostreptomyces psammosilenae TaxID=1892865 RepID=A0A852ZVL9_9ACTN|nr:phosphate ABC transporter permease subunit PstC [Allostreptomyces psammosilenae]NYI06279.1 phosphate transport system permease protein [Allostreptomyces psammosilenae]